MELQGVPPQKKRNPKKANFDAEFDTEQNQRTGRYRTN